jgi:uncharacterized membrane protein
MTDTQRAGDARSKTGRLIGVDAARGVALLGMMAVHVLPLVAADGTSSTSYAVAGGRSAALFAVLAGVGLALANGGTRPPRGRGWAAAALGTLVRAAIIAAIGLVVGVADSGIAVILVYYAALFVVAIPLLPLGPRILAPLAAVIAIVVPVLSYLVRPSLNSPDRGNPTLGTLLGDPVGTLETLLVTGYYPMLAWMAYLCAGLAVGRLNLRSTTTAWWLLIVGVGLALGSALVSSLLLGPLGGADALRATLRPGTDLGQVLDGSMYGNTPTTTWWWLAVDTPHSSTPFDLLHTTGTSLAVLAAMLLLARVAAPVLVPLAAAGSMTLTIYSTHVLLLATPFLPTDPTRSYVLQVAAALLLATIWRSTGRRGPLEAIVAAAAGRARRAVVPPPSPPPSPATIMEQSSQHADDTPTSRRITP